MAFHDPRIHRRPAQIGFLQNSLWPRPHDLRSASLSAPFHRLAGAIARARQRQKNNRILSALDDRALADIGLTRAEVDGLAPRAWRWL